LLGRGERANEIKCQKYVSLAAVANQTTNKAKDNGRPRTHAPVELLDELHTAGKQTRENQQAHAKGNSYSYLRANSSSLQLFLAYEKRKTCDISDLKLY